MEKEFSLVCHKTDRRRLEHAQWQAWMGQSRALAERFFNECEEDDPFCYGEAASVGFLATATAKANFLALPEFAVTKRSQLDRRRKGRGRSDLWVASDDRDWWFEAKQHL